MKFKDNLGDNRLLDEVRFNPNTLGKNTLINHAEQTNEDKRELGIMTVFSLMTMSSSYDESYSQSTDKNPVSIVSDMIEKSKSFIDGYVGEKHGL